MVQQSLELLDFPRVREVLAGFCRTEMGRELALSASPRPEPEWLGIEFDRIAELESLGEEPDIAAARDVRPLVERAAQGGGLTGIELVRVRQTCVAVRQARSFYGRRRERAAKTWQLVAMLVDQPGLEDDIGQALDETGEVVDSATPLLAETRQELRRLRNRLVDRLEQLAGAHPDWFSDRPTVRRDRFVLPVRVEVKEQMPGVIHESSASGHTLFIEPMESVGEQNRLAELRGIEAEETSRVLRELSLAVARVRADLDASLAGIGKLDFLLARARFASELECVRPELNDDRKVRLVGARHPLLFRRRRDMVPLDAEIPEGCAVTLISGPNAGGKTVALKTVGLLGLMAASGIPIPAARGTSLPLFKRVFADIGDQQSMDSDLSSFTAHVTRLSEILAQADGASLVLLDEIGSSTAPEEGAALAIAVLEHLRDRGVTTIATSHFGVLKVFVQGEKGMVNAAMGFRDNHPTYRLSIGLPGESSALEIAEAAGLPARLIERARQRLGSRWLDFDARLRELNQELDKARELRADLAGRERKAASAVAECERLKAGLEREQRLSADRLATERERFLKETRRQIENLVRQIKESGAEHATVVAAKSFVEQEITKLEREVETTATEKSTAERLMPGQTVESRSFGRRGTVEEVRPDAVVVAFGRIKMQVKPGDLKKVDEVDPGKLETRNPKPEIEPSSIDECAAGFATELNVRGMTREEAQDAVGRFLDEAVCAGVGRVIIVHGKGTGTLQRFLWNWMRSDARVGGLRLGEPNEGGSGVTFVTMGGAEMAGEVRSLKSCGESQADRQSRGERTKC